MFAARCIYLLSWLSLCLFVGVFVFTVLVVFFVGVFVCMPVASQRY